MADIAYITLPITVSEWVNMKGRHLADKFAFLNFWYDHPKTDELTKIGAMPMRYVRSGDTLVVEVEGYKGYQGDYRETLDIKMKLQFMVYGLDLNSSWK